LGLAQPLLQAIEELGFEAPTPVQEQTIPLFLAKQNDILALAQTGTGKTAAFGLPLIQHVNPKSETPQALVLSPTRELCVQIANDLKNFGKFIPNLNVATVYGGANIVAQIREIRDGAQIIVATPGRLMDMIERKAVDLSQIQYLILDEADEMLNMGFEEDVKHILSFCPKDKFVGLFSATMPSEIRHIANAYLHNPIEVSVGRKNAVQSNIEHKFSVVHLEKKYDALKRLLDYYTDFYGIIFCATKIQTQEISDLLVRDGYPADCLHGDLSQPQRDKVMNHFRHKAIKILLATDVAARGIDVNNLTHVLHYQLPMDTESYTHRSGRTARAGKQGISLAIILPRDHQKIQRLEKQIQTKFEYLPIPLAQEVQERKLAHFANTIALAEIDEHASHDKVVLNGVEELEKLDKRELILKILSLELRRFSKEYLQSPDLNAFRNGIPTDDRRSKTRGNDKESYSSTSYTRSSENSRETSSYSRRSEGESRRMFVNIGSVDKLRYDEMREFFYKNTGVNGKKIREIEMKDTYAFFETDPQSAEQIYQSFKQNGVELKGRSLRVDFAAALNRKSNDNRGGGSDYKKDYSDRKGGSSDFKKDFSDRKGGSSDFKKDFSDRKTGDKYSKFDKKPSFAAPKFSEYEDDEDFGDFKSAGKKFR